jgi:hypothetical protein
MRDGDLQTQVANDAGDVAIEEAPVKTTQPGISASLTPISGGLRLPDTAHPPLSEPQARAALRALEDQCQTDHPLSLARRAAGTAADGSPRDGWWVADPWSGGVRDSGLDGLCLALAAE